MMLKKLALIVLGSVSAFAMHVAEININNKDLELSVKMDIAEYNDLVEPDTTFLGFLYLKGTEENSEDEYGHNVNTNGYYELNFSKKKRILNDSLLLGIGIKLNYLRLNSESYITAPLGIEAGYIFSIGIPVTVGAKVYYAPESLAFSKADNFLEYRLEASAEIIQGGSIVVGYRNLDTNFNIDSNNYDVTYNKSGYIGLRFAF